MKRTDFIIIFIVSFLLILVNGCNSNKSKEQQLLGEWKAHWETKASQDLPDINRDNLEMNGILKFMENGQVEISAFGYEGCIFSDDTLKNVLAWKLDDSVLRFIDSGDENGLPYDIQIFSETELQLTLLEDINLTLYRN